MAFPDLFAEAYRLPAGKYLTPARSRIAPDETMCVQMYGTGVTNATSAIPVVGTTSFNPCVVVIAYNKKTKTAAVGHEPDFTSEHLLQLLNKVRSDPGDQVDLHIIGGAFHAERDVCTDDVNSSIIASLEDILHTIKDTPNVRLSTFDMYNKPKPYNVAIDSRTGKLIRGSDVFKTMETALECIKRSENDLFRGWPCTDDIGDDFDGTAPEYQKPRQRG